MDKEFSIIHEAHYESGLLLQSLYGSIVGALDDYSKHSAHKSQKSAVEFAIERYE
jgi:hypothetical protein